VIILPSALLLSSSVASHSCTVGNSIEITDEEIKNEAKHYNEGWGKDEADADFIEGAKWMRNKLSAVNISLMISMTRWATERNYFYECGAWFDLEEKICDTDEQLYNLFLKNQK
jgi:hypothetical protein